MASPAADLRSRVVTTRRPYRLGAAIVVWVLALWIATEPAHALSPGTPVYSQTVNDCVTGDHFVENTVNNQPDPGCDDYNIDFYERPFKNSTQDHFFPDLDIVKAELGADATWFYCRIELFGLLDGTKLDAKYACEIDVDDDGRFDWLIEVISPTSNVGTTFGQSGVIAWLDGNDDVGDNDPANPDPPQAGNGYDTKVSDQGAGTVPDGAWARIDPTDPTRVEIAFKRSMLGDPATIRWRAWAEKGLPDVSNWLHHDKFTAAEAGSPYVANPNFPSQNIYEDDNTCGINMTGANACPTFLVNAATITVDKVTVPADDPQLFEFDITSEGSTVDSFQLAHATAPHTTTVAAGTYQITETVPAGWSLTSALCTGGPFGSGGAYTNGADIVLGAAGEAITCTFTNTKQATLIVKKVMVGGTDTFTFTGTPAGSISTNNGTISTTVAPGTYTSTEAGPPAGWTLSSISCNDSDSTGNVGTKTATFVAAAGETVTCTFTNTEQATLIVKKVMVGGTDTFTFTGTPAGSISTNNGTISTTVAPGTYTSTEAGPPAGWTLSSISCNDSNSTGNVGTSRLLHRRRRGDRHLHLHQYPAATHADRHQGDQPQRHDHRLRHHGAPAPAPSPAAPLRPSRPARR